MLSDSMLSHLNFNINMPQENVFKRLFETTWHLLRRVCQMQLSPFVALDNPKPFFQMN